MTIPILEVGGTHVTAAWVRSADWTVRTAHRHALDASASAEELIGVLAVAAAQLAAPAGSHWGVAMPGPFDYQRGIARYTGVGKFDQLAGVDVRAELERSLPGATTMTFVNDASAFLLGEWLTGGARGARRSMALTLGTGVGSAFLADGEIVDDGSEVPEQGEVHLLQHRGAPLEDWVSRRAIRRAYARLTAPEGDGDSVIEAADVAEITDRARAGETAAQRVIVDAFGVLGEVIGPWARRFRAEVIVIGGSISRSFDLIEGPFRDGLSDDAQRVTCAQHLDSSSLIGTAYSAHSDAPSERTSSTSTGPSPAPSPTNP